MGALVGMPKENERLLANHPFSFAKPFSYPIGLYNLACLIRSRVAEASSCSAVPYLRELSKTFDPTVHPGHIAFACGTR